MPTKPLVLLTSLVLSVMVFGACSTSTTLTVPAKTVTLPAVTSVLPAVTVTLPGKVTTIPATTVVIPASVTVLPATIVGPPEADVPTMFLPTTPIGITSHMANVVGDLTGDCIGCHGENTSYYQFPLPPDWDGATSGSLVNVNFYYVIPGSLQDHTGRTSDICLTCHVVKK